MALASAPFEHAYDILTRVQPHHFQVVNDKIVNNVRSREAILQALGIQDHSDA
jgi:hypothetical protein